MTSTNATGFATVVAKLAQLVAALPAKFPAECIILLAMIAYIIIPSIDSNAPQNEINCTLIVASMCFTSAIIIVPEFTNEFAVEIAAFVAIIGAAFACMIAAKFTAIAIISAIIITLVFANIIGNAIIDKIVAKNIAKEDAYNFNADNDDEHTNFPAKFTKPV